MTQRGFAWLPLIPYLVGGLALIGAVTYVYQLVDNSWATDAGIAEGRKLEQADQLPKTNKLKSDLSDAKQTVESLMKLIERQNGAVRALEAAGKARQARAMAGVKEAEKRAKTAQNEAQRLREAILAPVGGCEAAVSEVRRGLGAHK